MGHVLILLTAGLIIFGICWFLKNYRCTKIDEDPEGFRRGGWGRGGRWWGGRRGGWWGSWGGYPTYWGPYGYPVYSTEQCIPSTETESCPSSRPVKIGYDSNGNGVNDSWKCCN